MFQPLDLLRRASRFFGIGKSSMKLANQRSFLGSGPRLRPRFTQDIAANGQQLLTGDPAQEVFAGERKTSAS